jgi:outer membrane protein assembly factor BamB
MRKAMGCLFSPFRAAGRLLRSKLLWTLILLTAAAVFSYHALKPRIVAIPVISAGDALEILGRSLGGTGRIHIAWPGGGEALAPAKMLTWTPDRVVTPGNAASAAGMGRVRLEKMIAGFAWAVEAAFVIRESGLPSEPYGYEVPVQPESPWPLFRRDRRNTGCSPIRARYNGGAPWKFRTGKGIFSTPVIAADGTVYAGSADHFLYALNPDGSEKWRFGTGDIIDSAAAIHRDGGVTFVSGDGIMYHLRTDGKPSGLGEFFGRHPEPETGWTFDAAALPGEGYINWWEGNTAIGYDGTLFAGNTNWNYYAVNPGGTVQWRYPTGSNNWSMAAFGDDAAIYWGALDTKVHCVAPGGRPRWTKRTLGPIAASAAIGPDGTVYIGSFDSYFYALDPAGNTKWRLKTDDHIYSSAALAEKEAGKLGAVCVASTDGMVYALNPDGSLRWRYDTGAPIRSSPAIGRVPEGENGFIVYVGSSNGKLYALNLADGTRRWSIDTTESDPELADRNDLNASPALGEEGVYIAGEHGYIWFVPYDYPLYHPEDPRVSTDPGEEYPDDLAELYYVTPGGSTLRQPPPELAPECILTFRLVVRENGETRDARLHDGRYTVSTDLDLAFTTELSPDGHYLHIVPETFMDSGGAAACEWRIAGEYFTGGHDIGNLTFGGKKRGVIEKTFRFRFPEWTGRLPFETGPERVGAVEWTRLAVPVPAMMPSLNQIGFDYYDCILSTIAVRPDKDAAGSGRLILWLASARRNEAGELVPDPDPDFLTPVNGRYDGHRVILRNRGFAVENMGLRVPLNVLEIRASFQQNGRVRPGANVYGDADVMSVPSFGPLLVLAGLANNIWEKLCVAGTFITRPYAGPAVQRPEGVRVTALEFHAGTRELVATIEANPGAAWKAEDHRASIVLIDGAEAVFLDYLNNTRYDTDSAGNLKAVRLRIPEDIEYPGNLEAVVLLDAFPAYFSGAQ